MPNSSNLLPCTLARPFTECERKAFFNLFPPPGMVTVEDKFADILARRGIEHEANVRALFEPVTVARSAEHTKQLMAQGVSVIYQAVLEDREIGFVGVPDFLVRTQSGEYQIVDAKSARSVKDRPDIKIQLGMYRRLLRSPLPALVHLGSGEIVSIGEEADLAVDSFIEKIRKMRETEGMPDVSYADSRCSACAYEPVCTLNFTENDDLSLLPIITNRERTGLITIGIRTISDLAKSDATLMPTVKGMPHQSKKHLAVLQAQSYQTKLPIQIAHLKLPASPLIHFDVEANQLCESGRDVYLWGLLGPPYLRESFIGLWLEDGESDFDLWMGFLNRVSELRKALPTMRLCHFSNYEVATVNIYAARYGMSEDSTVKWLLEEGLFDLLDTLKATYVLPTSSYGLKAVCKNPDLLNFQWELKESGSQWSTVRYLEYLKCTDFKERDKIRQELETYNRDDLLASRALEEWMIKIDGKLRNDLLPNQSH